MAFSHRIRAHCQSFSRRRVDYEPDVLLWRPDFDCQRKHLHNPSPMSRTTSMAMAIRQLTKSQMPSGDSSLHHQLLRSITRSDSAFRQLT